MPYLCAPAPSQPNSSTSDKLQTCASIAERCVRIGFARGLKQVLIPPSMVMIWPCRIGKLV